MSRKKSENMINYGLLLNRLRRELNLKTDTQLAEFLGFSQNTISTWRDTGISGDGWNVIIGKCDNVDFHKLITGECFEGKESAIYQEVDEYTKTVTKPDGEVIEEKRKSFRKPYVKQIVDKIDRMDNEERLKILKIMDLIVDNEEDVK